MADGSTTVDGSKVERKTLFSALAAYVIPLLALGAANWLGDANLFDSMPDWLETILAPLIPALSAFLVGYGTSHRPGAMSLSARRALGAARR